MVHNKVHDKVHDRGVKGRRTRKAIALQLLEGRIQSAIAKSLKLSPSYVSRQTRKLVSDKILIPTEGGREKFYTKGPNYRLLPTYGVGYGKLRPDYRSHNLSAKCKVLKLPVNIDSLPWTKQWDSSGTHFRSLRLDTLATTVILANNKTLIIRPDDMLVEPLPESLSEAERMVDGKFHKVIKHLSSELGFGLSLPTKNMDSHYAQEIPELKSKKLPGKVKIDEDTWLDESHEGHPEWETDNLSEAVAKETAYKYLPTLIEQIRQFMVEVKGNNEAINTLVGVFGEAIAKLTEQSEIQSEILKKLSGEYIPPTDTKNEDKQPPGYL